MRRLLLAALLAGTLAACTTHRAVVVDSAPSPTAPGGTLPIRVTQPSLPALDEIRISTVDDQTVGMPPGALDLTRLPVGTGKQSQQPTRGQLYRCPFPAGGPAVTTPPWVHGRTWDATAKLAVGGRVRWSPSFTRGQTGSSLVLTGNSLPALSGAFPVQRTDPSYPYNPNPGSVSEHPFSYALPAEPKAAAAPSCESGLVGIALDGVPVLDAFDSGGNDAVAVETLDRCHGHPNNDVGYHYHALSPCLLTATSRRTTAQVGWALDGFGIFAEYDDQHRLLTNADLDGCHGRVSEVPWQGRVERVYHYVTTWEFPYTVGCFTGTPVATGPPGGQGGQGPGGPPPGGPAPGGPAPR